MKKKLRRIASFLFLGLVILYAGSCRWIDTQLGAETAEGLTRTAMKTRASWTVSYLSGGKTGTGPRLIYVHGTPGSATAFNEYLLDPVDGLESISIDRPGFGATEPLAPALTLGEQALAIDPFLIERDGRWPILIGHSMGAPIICKVAAMWPGKVGGLVILSGALDSALEEVYWYQRVADFAFVPYLIPRILRNSNTELVPLKHELELLRPQLAAIQCPVTIVHAPNDSLVPFANVEYMKSHIPNIRDVVILEGMDHFTPWNSRPAIVDAIRKLVQAP